MHSLGNCDKRFGISPYLCAHISPKKLQNSNNKPAQDLVLDPVLILTKDYYLCMYLEARLVDEKVKTSSVSEIFGVGGAKELSKLRISDVVMVLILHSC